MPHFFVNSNEINNKNIQIKDKETYNHIAKSLRIKSGEGIFLIDENRIQYEGLVKNITTKTVDIEIKKSYKSERYLKFRLYLAQSPLRSEAQNLIIEKATELGVDGVYPIYTDNCALKKNVIEQKISEYNFNIVLAFTEREAQFNLKKYLSETPIQKDEKILIIIGPEGGFSEKEFRFF